MRTTLQESRPLLNAIQFVLQHTESTETYYPEEIAEIVIDKVISSKWHDAVIECEERVQHNKKKIIKKVNRINYELAVLDEFRKQLNCKMIWIEGAYRYRDPNEDLPKDFEENREFYYRMLGLPLDVQEYIASRKNKLDENLRHLNNSILVNPKVKITTRNGGHIKISPYDPQIEPPNIKKLHRAIKKEWPSINLIDILKETDLDIEFIQLFQTVASREALSDGVLRFRLLLCLYAMGTNTGIKAVSAANASTNESNLRYVKRKFINVDAVRQAIVKIINKTLEIRDPRIFGEATTSVACDSKKLSVWDQNLLVEWHARYRGRGVMVYWHVEKKALCVYSQLKTCSSSEVGAMLKGLLQHCTDMEIDSVYVDTHGQSTLAFGVSDLLEIDLLPRLKNISKQKLYYSSSQAKEQYKNLDLILKESIKWKLIEENYDEAVKHVVALKLGIMEPDVFVKRFSRDNYQHPVYKAIIEMGKIKKTNFLCCYLDSEELRMEVHESQNVVERLNSIMGFIFYGKLGEISTNIKEDQELAIVCLHLLQACMSYVNTIIFQTVLSRPEWQNKLTIEDKRALNLLFHSHINPYGLFPWGILI